MCVSVNIPVPYRLNIINVADFLPALYAGYPKAGFGSFSLLEVGEDLFPAPNPFYNYDFTAFMWSYQRQQRSVKIPYPVDEKKLFKFDTKYGVITDNEMWSVSDPADRLRR